MDLRKGMEGSSAAGGVRRVAASKMEGPDQGFGHTRQHGIPEKQRYFEDTLHRKELCDNLINSLKILTNQQKDGDSPVENAVAG